MVGARWPNPVCTHCVQCALIMVVQRASSRLNRISFSALACCAMAKEEPSWSAAAWSAAGWSVAAKDEYGDAIDDPYLKEEKEEKDEKDEKFEKDEKDEEETMAAAVEEEAQDLEETMAAAVEED